MKILKIIACLFILTLPSAGIAKWRRAVSQHFVVYGEISADRLQSFTQRIERFDALLRWMQIDKVEDEGARLTIFLVHDTNSVARLAGSSTVAGFYAPRIWGNFAYVPANSEEGEFALTSEQVLLHEYSHHFVLQYFPNGYPAWYVEGYAEFFASTAISEDGTASIGLPPKYRYAAILLGTKIPVTRLLAPDRGKMDGDDLDAYYGWSWALCHYLSLDPSRPGQLSKYLALYASGSDPLDAARQAFGDLEKLQKDLTAHIFAPHLFYLKIRELDLAIKPIAVSDLPPDEDAVLPSYILMMRGPRGDRDIASFVADARRNADRFPNSPMALELLAEGELDAKNYDAASRANDAALAMQPGDARLLLRRARIFMARLEPGKASAKDWQAARVLIAKANHVAPDDPFPLATYYESFKDEGVTAPDMAAAGLERALDLAPQVADLRMEVGRVKIGKGDTAGARRVLSPLLNDAHDKEMRDAARALLDPPPAKAAATAAGQPEHGQAVLPPEPRERVANPGGRAARP